MVEDNLVPVIHYVEDEDAHETRLGELLAVPAAPSHPHLVVVGGLLSVGKIFRLRDGMIIGRALGCDIVLEEEGVSRRHARIRVHADGTAHAEDLGSSNGLHYMGHRVTTAPLRDGERVRIGEASVVLLQIDDVDETLRANLLGSVTEDVETKLLLRRHFLDVVSREIAIAQRYRAKLSVVVLAVEQYKEIVDRSGGAAAAATLRRCASFIRTHTQREDVVLARYAEDCVSVLLPDTSGADARSFAELIALGIRRAPLGEPREVTLGIGVATLDDDRSAQALLERAELARLQSKLERKSQAP